MKKYIKYILIAWVLFLWFLLYIFYSYKSFENTKYNVDILKIEKWDIWKKVIYKLCKKIWNCFNLIIYSRLHSIDNIKPWNYSFSQENISWIFKQFKNWPLYAKIIIIPWDTKFDIYEKIKKVSWNKIADKFLNLIDNEEFIKKLDFQFFNDFWNVKSLEGFLYPDTYFFKQEDLQSVLFPELLIKTLLKNFQKKTSIIDCNKDCNPYHLINYENLIIASIVQKEEFNNENKSLIADILIRRYKNNWWLWADWTLCYGLNVLSSECKNYLYDKYLNDGWNPYNTRWNKWLPPTPVWNPTIETIKATIFPKKNNYWYYLHDKNANIYFSENLQQHNNYKNKYLK